ncbi:MAG: RND transporter [Chloracidobacterium sp. CP2_5A]|nr:MAG: RND transporter [Chloracidobacterium sp. CP2_5A]
MQKLAELCIKRPVFATMLVMAFIVVGAFSYFKLGVDLFPKIDLPTVTITTRLDGASPEEIESQVTKRIEEAVNTIGGVDELRSVSAEGVSQVFVVFALERDIDEAAQDVRDKVNRILGELPSDAKAPIIEKLDPDAQPVLSLALSGNRSAREITEIADKVVKQNLESLNGVGRVSFIGDRKREIQIMLDASKIAAYNLSVDAIKQALRAQNVEIPGGRLEDGQRELSLRTLGRVTRVEDFANIIVGTASGLPIYVKDIGYVEDGVEEPRSLARLDGRPAVILEVRKQSGTNTLEVARLVKERMAELAPQLPPDCRVQYLKDQSIFVQDAFDAVQEHLILGGIMAALVMLLFLRSWRSTVISAIAIPASVVATYGLMYAMGFTLNRMTMLALVLSVGIVIDDAVVVLENIYRFMEEKGMSAFEAAKEATSDIGFAVLATTLSLVVIFIPVAFMGGIVGRFMSSFGFTCAFAILVSMFISFTLTPMLCSRFLRPSSKAGAGHASARASGVYGRLERGYVWLLEWSLRRPLAIVGISLLTVAAVVPIFSVIGKNFIPFDDAGMFEVVVKLPEGVTLAEAEKQMAALEAIVKTTPHVTSYLTTLGGDEQRRVTRGNIFVQLTPLTERKLTQADLMQIVRDKLADQRDKRISVQYVQAISGGGNSAAPVQYVVRGPDLAKLTDASQQLMDFLKTVPGVVDVDTTLEVGKPEIRAVIDREKAASLGVNVATIASALRTLVAGEIIGSYREGDDRYDVRFQLRGEDRTGSDTLLRSYVPSTKLGNVPLANLVAFTSGRGPAQIDRYNRQRQVTLSANLQEGYSLDRALQALDEKARTLGLGPEYRAAKLGQSKELGKAAANFLLAFVLSFVFMYMILAAQFESFLHPVTILLSLPMAVPFALLSLISFGETLNIFSALGILMLFGVVKKNSILQIDHISTLRAGGQERYAAIVAGCRDRLRPILMTTLALVAGLIPMAVAQTPGSAALRSVAIIIIGGQSLCLLLTLVAIPVFYQLFDALTDGSWWRARFDALRALWRSAPRAEAPADVSAAAREQTP